MRKFNRLLEEVTIKGNPGIPGEGDKRPGDKNYLSDIESRAKTRLDINRANPNQLMGRLMQLVGMSQRFSSGKERELEQLAEDVILNYFDDILDGVELDIKLVRSGNQVADFFEEESEDEDDSEMEIPSFRKLTDPNIINKIHKGKIGNNIIQGEAKNTKHMLHTPEVKSGLNRIFGNDRGRQIFEIWDELSKIADKMDWIIPIQAKADMMERAPGGAAGAVKVDWEPSKEADDESKDSIDKMLNDIASGDKPDKESIDDFNEQIEGTSPVIRSRGIDFPMLLHETVKGIYELIAAVSRPGMDASPEEIEIGKTVELNIGSFLDEAEDFRTGPEIAADFRDFINKSPDASYTPNIRAFVFGRMMDNSYMSDKEFLELFRGILNETPEARRKIDSIVSEIVDELKRYELGEVLGHEDDYEDDYDNDYDDDFETYGQTDIDDTEDFDDVQGETDYSKLSQRELKSLIDEYLDKRDFDEVSKLSKYLNESTSYLNYYRRDRRNRRNRRW